MPLTGAPQGQHNWWTKGLGGSRRTMRNWTGGWTTAKSLDQEGRKVKPIPPPTPSHFTDRKTSRTNLTSLKLTEHFVFKFLLPFCPSFFSYSFFLPSFISLFILIFVKILSSLLPSIFSFLLPSFLPLLFYSFFLPSLLPFFFFILLFPHVRQKNLELCKDQS